MTYQTLTVQPAGPIARVSLNRPALLNCLSVECLREIKAVFNELARNRTIRAVVLTGSDKFFCAGMDLKDKAVRQMLSGPEDQRRDLVLAGPEACQAIEDCPAITIAAVEGFCLGGGASLAISCDFRVLAETAYFRIPEIDLGLNYSWGSIPRLVSLIGPAHAKEAVILCESIPADKCLAWGLTDRIAPTGQALAGAMELAEKVAAKPPIPAAMTKQAVNRTAAALSQTAAFMDADQFLLTAATEDHREGLAAFLEKRIGVFKGK